MNVKLIGLVAGLGVFALAAPVGGFFAVQAMLKPTIERTVESRDVDADFVEGKAVEPVLMKLDPVRAPIFRGPKYMGVAVLRLELELPGKSDSDQVRDRMPQLRDLMISDFFGDPIRVDEVTGEFDVPAVRKRLLRAMHKVLGHEMVRDIHIRNIAPGA